MTRVQDHAADDPHPNVVLTGFMGTGKTTVGRLLATRLGRRFVDTDDLIEDRYGPIPAIFETAGEAEFREIERRVAEELSEQTDLVVSTGGRLMLDEQNRGTLGGTGRVFCLAASAEAIAARVIRDGRSDRPLLAGPNPRARIDELLAERLPLYEEFEQVDTTSKAVAQIVEEIVGRLESEPPGGWPIVRQGRS